MRRPLRSGDVITGLVSTRCLCGGELSVTENADGTPKGSVDFLCDFAAIIEAASYEELRSGL